MSREKRDERNPASRAVIDLRERLKLTQQRFAVEIMDCAVPTVGKWETSSPPTGSTLLRLADVAERKGCFDLQQKFRELYSRERPSYAHLGALASLYLPELEEGLFKLGRMPRLPRAAKTEIARLLEIVERNNPHTTAPQAHAASAERNER